MIRRSRSLEILVILLSRLFPVLSILGWHHLWAPAALMCLATSVLWGGARLSYVYVHYNDANDIVGDTESPK
jgi:ABC-type polysaccharide/polyol phosphate export permease